jgi:hypothetical protein
MYIPLCRQNLTADCKFQHSFYRNWLYRDAFKIFFTFEVRNNLKTFKIDNTDFEKSPE